MGQLEIWIPCEGVFRILFFQTLGINIARIILYLTSEAGQFLKFLFDSWTCTSLAPFSCRDLLSQPYLLVS